MLHILLCLCRCSASIIAMCCQSTSRFAFQVSRRTSVESLVWLHAWSSCWKMMLFLCTWHLLALRQVCFRNTTSIQLCRTTSTFQCSGSVLLFTTQDFRDMMVVSVCPKTFVTCSWCNICEGRSVIGHYVRTGVFFRFPGSAA